MTHGPAKKTGRQRSPAERCGVIEAKTLTPPMLQNEGSGRSDPMAIRILVTGGTFDKEYDELTGRLFFKDTHIQELLRLGPCRASGTVETVMMIDSLDMTAADRETIARRCREAAEKWIVITHGTDTMGGTAGGLAGP